MMQIYSQNFRIERDNTVIWNPYLDKCYRQNLQQKKN